MCTGMVRKKRNKQCTASFAHMHHQILRNEHIRTPPARPKTIHPHPCTYQDCCVWGDEPLCFCCLDHVERYTILDTVCDSDMITTMMIAPGCSTQHRLQISQNPQNTCPLAPSVPTCMPHVQNIDLSPCSSTPSVW